MFRQLIYKIADTSDKDKDVPLDKHFTGEEDLYVVNGWVLMSLAACTADADLALHAKLRSNIAALT